MAVIDEYYNSRLDLGPPAAVALLAGFMGERERMNRAIIDQMLAAADPSAIAEAEKEARKAKNDLLKLKAEMSKTDVKANLDLLKLANQYEIAQMGAQSRERVAVTAARAAMARTAIYNEQRRQQEISGGSVAADPFKAQVASASTTPAASEAALAQQIVNAIDAGVSSASPGLRTQDARSAMEATLAEQAIQTLEARKQTAAAKALKDRYLRGLDPAQWRTTYQRPKTDDEINADVARRPLGGITADSPFAKALTSNTRLTNEQYLDLLYKTVTVDGDKSVSTVIGDKPTDPAVADQAVSATVAALGGASPGAAPSGEIDAAIAEIDREIADLKAQRGRSLGLQDVARRRYPNYLYANPFQVASRDFDKFTKDVAQLSPRAGERYVRAMAEAPPILPSRFAAAALERTEPAQVETEGFRFEERGVDVSRTGGPVFESIATALEKTDARFARPFTMADGSTVTLSTAPDGTAVATVRSASGATQTVSAKKDPQAYGALYQGLYAIAARETGLGDVYAQVPDAFAEQYLQSVNAATASGGLRAGAQEARRQILTAGDFDFADVYSEELLKIAQIPDGAQRSDALEALAQNAPKGASWAADLERVARSSTIEDATAGATSLGRALRTAREATAAGEPTRAAVAATRAAVREREDFDLRAAEGIEVPNLGTVRRDVNTGAVSLRPLGAKDFVALPAAAEKRALEEAQKVPVSVPAAPKLPGALGAAVSGVRVTGAEVAAPRSEVSVLPGAATPRGMSLTVPQIPEAREEAMLGQLKTVLADPEADTLLAAAGTTRAAAEARAAELESRKAVREKSFTTKSEPDAAVMAMPLPTAPAPTPVAPAAPAPTPVAPAAPAAPAKRATTAPTKPPAAPTKPPAAAAKPAATTKAAPAATTKAAPAAPVTAPAAPVTAPASKKVPTQAELAAAIRAMEEE